MAPERLESIFMKGDFVDQIFVHGDSMKDYLVAIVVPNKAVLRGWAAQHLKLKEVVITTACSALYMLLISSFFFLGGRSDSIVQDSTAERCDFAGASHHWQTSR